MHLSSLARALCAAILFSCAGAAMAEPPGDPTAVKKDETGKWTDAKGDPTYKIEPDGTLDWFSYSGFRRYHSECHVCHGPDAEGSSYAPALKNSLKVLSYPEFVGIVVGGRQNVTTSQTNVMPAFGDNKNVMCYLDDIYVYIRGRSTGAIARGRPPGRVDKEDKATTIEKECLGLDK